MTTDVWEAGHAWRLTPLLASRTSRNWPLRPPETSAMAAMAAAVAPRDVRERVGAVDGRRDARSAILRRREAS